MNNADFFKFAAEEGEFRVGEAVYVVDEDRVDVYARLDTDGEKIYLVFDTDPDPDDSDVDAKSWSVWVELGKIKQLLDLAETQK